MALNSLGKNTEELSIHVIHAHTIRAILSLADPYINYETLYRVFKVLKVFMYYEMITNTDISEDGLKIKKHSSIFLHFSLTGVL